MFTMGCSYTNSINNKLTDNATSDNDTISSKLIKSEIQENQAKISQDVKLSVIVYTDNQLSAKLSNDSPYHIEHSHTIYMEKKLMESGINLLKKQLMLMKV